MKLKAVDLERELDLTLGAEPHVVRFVRDVVDNFCRAISIDDQDIDDLKIVVSEACTNVVRHAYNGHHGSLRLTLRASQDQVVLSVIDYGKGVVCPVSSATIRRSGKLASGGLGVYIITQLVDNINFLSRNNGTEVRLVKHI
ncbi:MAG: ATP-binding protein [Actinobacteria bacterium]|nr:ATP-binding protein [Actinomycetota bacterium]